MNCTKRSFIPHFLLFPFSQVIHASASLEKVFFLVLIEVSKKKKKLFFIMTYFLIVI